MSRPPARIASGRSEDFGASGGFAGGVVISNPKIARQQPAVTPSDAIRRRRTLSVHLPEHQHSFPCDYFLVLVLRYASRACQRPAAAPSNRRRVIDGLPPGHRGVASCGGTTMECHGLAGASRFECPLWNGTLPRPHRFRATTVTGILLDRHDARPGHNPRVRDVG